MASLIPKGQEASLFGFYSLCGKTAAVMGPVIFGTASLLTGGNQRVAILAVGLMFVAGLVPARACPGRRAGGRASLTGRPAARAQARMRAPCGSYSTSGATSADTRSPKTSTSRGVPTAWASSTGKYTNPMLRPTV